MRSLLYPHRPSPEMAVADLDAANATRYCRDCGNPDCPNVSTDPYWSRCPASDRLAFAAAKRHAVERGEKVVAAFGRIAPHSRRRVGK